MGEGHARLALLRRLATDMHVVTSREPVVRPSEMPCCWVFYDKPNGHGAGQTTTWAKLLCQPDCSHVHHLHERVLAPVAP